MNNKFLYFFLLIIIVSSFSSYNRVYAVGAYCVYNNYYCEDGSSKCGEPQDNGVSACDDCPVGQTRQCAGYGSGLCRNLAGDLTGCGSYGGCGDCVFPNPTGGSCTDPADSCYGMSSCCGGGGGGGGGGGKVNGVCDYTVDSTGYPATQCSSGSTSSFRGAGSGWAWRCLASGGGTDADCSMSTPTPSCGGANGVAVSSAPSSNLCSTGTAGSVTGSGPWNWSCNFSYVGTSASCIAPKATVVNGSCAATHYNCNQGTSANNVSGASAWTWACNGSGGGINATNCSEAKIATNCGPGSSATPQLTEPSGASACTAGAYTNSPPDTTTNGLQAWNWSCGTVTTCSAPKYGCNRSYDSNYNATGPNNDWACSGTCANGASNYPTCTGAQPDLTAGNPVPTTAVAGTALTFTIAITNSGTAATSASFLNLFQVSSDGGTTASVISVNSRAALAAGASGPVTSSLYTFPSSGTYQVRVCADNNASFVGTIAESDENNNCGPWTNVTVNSGGGMTCSLSVNPTTVYINGSDTWTWTAISNPPGYVTKAYGTKDGVVDINGGNNFGTTNSTVVSGPAGVGAQSVRTRWFTISDPVTNALLCTSNQATVTIKTVSSSSFSLTVDKTIGGSVKSSDNGISCGTTCSNNYVSGSTVTLTAYPDSTNWKFAGWSGSCSGLGNCSLIINGPKTVKALFVPVPSDYREF